MPHQFSQSLLLDDIKEVIRTQTLNNYQCASLGFR